MPCTFCRLPEGVNSSRIQIKICNETEPGCEDGSQPADIRDGIVRLRAGITDRQLAVALQDAKNVKILSFDSMGTAFGGHEDPAEGERFMKRTMWYTSLWCCVHASPGHVWYDMWWDVVPHRDRHNRRKETKWRPELGP